MIKVSTLMTIAFLAIAGTSFSQTCSSVTTTSPLGVTFGTQIAVLSTNDFSSSNQSPAFTYQDGTTSSITSPIYKFNTPQTSVWFSFTLTATANPSSTVTPTIQFKYGSPLHTYSCTPANFTVSTTATAYYFQITLPQTFPA